MRLRGSGEAAGATALIVHARKAWLKGLSPKDNRSIPPLDYELVHRLKRVHPDWPIILNGGLADIDAARAHLAHVDGIMLGRAAYQNPELLIAVDPALFGEPAPVADGFEAIEACMPTIARGLSAANACTTTPATSTACSPAGEVPAPTGKSSRPKRSAPAPGSRCCVTPSPAWSEGVSTSPRRNRLAATSPP